MDGPLEFVFSFRSPYAWIAARCVLPQLPAGTEVQWRPFYPLPSFENFNRDIPAKRQYLIRDVMRLCKAHALDLTWPSADDPDWAIPHVAFLEAERQGRGPAFGLEIYEARFGRGEDVAERAVVERAARDAGLDPGPIVAAGFDEERRRALDAHIAEDYAERGIFGVPMFLLPKGTRFWGHERMQWALEQGLVGS